MFFVIALLVSIYHSHSKSLHKPSQKFNMCDFFARSQPFIAKAVIACDHWCSYMVRYCSLLCVLLTHACMETRLQRGPMMILLASSYILDIHLCTQQLTCVTLLVNTRHLQTICPHSPSVTHSTSETLTQISTTSPQSQLVYARRARAYNAPTRSFQQQPSKATHISQVCLLRLEFQDYE